jgi:sugar/nucleoside kinase (ribokinase family)
MHDVITIGSGTRDVFLISDKFKLIESEEFSTGVGECVALGSKIEIEKIVHSTGGGATNAAVTFANLGFETAAACRVGDDDPGEAVIRALERYGIDADLVIQAAGQTAYSTLLTTKQGERSVLVYRGVAKQFQADELPLKKCEGDWFYMTSLGGNLDLAKTIIRHTQDCDSAISWNPGSGEIGQGLEKCKDVLPMVDVLNVNREEAGKLTGKEDIPDMMDKLAHPGNVVIITDGADGAYAHKDGVTYFAGTTDAEAISRTGAGDAFGSGFAAAYMKSGELDYALAVGTVNAESVIQKHGAKNGLLEDWPSEEKINEIPIKQL